MLALVFAAGPIDLLTSIYGIAFVLFIILLSLVLFLAKRYRRCPSNAVLVVYGAVGGGQSAKTVHGGGTFVWPIIQDYDYLTLEPIQIEIPLRDALSHENIRVNVPSVFTVAIGTEPAVMQNAAIRLLGLKTDQVKKQAEDIIFGQLRQVIASMRIEDINRDRDAFLGNIHQNLEPELEKIGLVLINVNITDITDESGYIEAIGQRAAAEAVQNARADVAEQEKLGEIRVAAADRDKLVQVADANKVKEIGIREAARTQAVKIAELNKEQQVAEQRAAYERDTAVADAEREKRIAVAAADALAIKGETEAQGNVADAQAKLQVRQAEAYQLGETRKREAAAAVEEAQHRALAKAALAEAERIEAERRAELEAPAKAQKAKTIVEAEAAAEKRKLEANAEAAAIFARLEAEARGEYEKLARKGEGLKQIVAACGGSREAFQLLMLEQLEMLAAKSAEAISNIKFDKIVVWDNGSGNGSGNGRSMTSNFLQSMSRTLPPMMQVMKDIGGVEMPEYLAKLSGFDGETDTRPVATHDTPTEPANGKKAATAAAPGKNGGKETA
jgi:flotillin